MSFHDGDAVAVIAPFVAEGLALGEPALLVATADHLVQVDAALGRLGWDPDLERSCGRLVTLDAAATLDTFMHGDFPDPATFRSMALAFLDDIRGEAPTMRVFGEMVAVLWERGNVAGVLALEQLWCELQQERSFTLLCGYPHDVLDQASLADVGQVCSMHSDVLPPTSYQGTHHHDPDLDEASWAFLPVARAIPALRRFVGDTLRAWGEDRLVEDAVLVTSEIATNAISHAASPFHASITRIHGVIHIAIEDAGPGAASARIAALDEVSGRGIAIVEALSDRWGHGAVPGGKVVWAELSA